MISLQGRMSPPRCSCALLSSGTRFRAPLLRAQLGAPLPGRSRAPLLWAYLSGPLLRGAARGSCPLGRSFTRLQSLLLSSVHSSALLSSGVQIGAPLLQGTAVRFSLTWRSCDSSPPGRSCPFLSSRPLFKASDLWADAFYKSICPSVRLYVCPSVHF